MLILSTISQRINRWLGPFLLRQGIQLRYKLSGGVIRDNARLDAFTLLPLAQKLISLEIHEEISRLGSSKSSWTLFDTPDASNPSNDIDPQLRLAIVERYLRPALIPHETWWNVTQWQFHARLIKWVRSEILQAQYPVRPFRSLPTSAQLTSVLQTQDWATTKQPRHGPMQRLAQPLNGQVFLLYGGGLAVTHIPDPDTSLADYSLPEIVQVAGGLVLPCGPLNALCEKANLYQIWTREYVEQLGDYLQQRTAAHTQGETIVVDVGAGDGKLVQYLQEYLDNRQASTTFQEPKQKGRPQVTAPSTSSQPVMPRLVATDDQSWRIPHAGRVENLTVQEAMDKYAITADVDQTDQIIVLCSWMPMGEDWTHIFREYQVDEYILIGEADDGQCGDNWLTWGNIHYHPDCVAQQVDAVLGEDDATEGVPSSMKNLPAPYQEDGYERKNLDSLTPFQFSRFDCRLSKAGQTVSFRRRR